MEGFSVEAKAELAQIRTEKNCCRKAELAGLSQSAGRIRLSRVDGMTLIIETENAAIARKTVWLFREVFQLAVEVILEKRVRLGKRHAYRLEVPPGDLSRMVLSEMKILHRDNQLNAGISAEITRQDCCRWSFLRGAFLGAGSISDPVRGSYHMEFVTENADFAQGLFYLLSLGRLKAKTAERKHTHLVYLKEADSIVTLLSQMGASHTVLEIENIRVIKGMRNGVNRLVNAETANLTKAAESGADQVKMIVDLDRRIGLGNLPESLREFVSARMEHPEMSLRELGAVLNPPAGKSAMNHRLRRLRELWEIHCSIGGD